MKKIILSLTLFLLISCSGTIPADGEVSTVNFSKLFNTVGNGQYEPIYPIKIGGISFGKGTKIGGLVGIGSIKLEHIKNKQITVINQNGVMVFQRIES